MGEKEPENDVEEIAEVLEIENGETEERRKRFQNQCTLLINGLHDFRPYG